jgi:hypothetical protein
MLPTTVNSQSCWLLPSAPNTDASVRLGVTLPVSTVRGKTGRSSRRPQDLALRCSQEWTAEITLAEFSALRNASQAAQDEPLLVPAWIFATAAGTALPISSGLSVAWTRGWAAWAINPGSLAGFDFHAPLLYGRLHAPPRLASRNGEQVLADFSFDEDGPASFALVPPTASDVTFATASGYHAPVFPWVPEGGTLPVPGAAVSEVDRRAIGPGRMKAPTFYPQTAERTLAATVKFKTAAAAVPLLGWWSRRAGTADSHWVAETQSMGRLTADAAAAATSLAFAAGHQPLGPNSALALYDVRTLELTRVTAATSTTLTLAAGLAHAWPARTTNVALAMLARHTNDELVLDCRRAGDDWLIETTLNWREVAAEYTVPDGETRGTTLGRLPGAWFGFQLDLDYNGALQTWYLTNFASGATVDGHDWVYNPCDFDQATASIDLQDDACTFTARWFAGGPWENWLPGRLAARGHLTIYRADAAPDGTFSNFAALGKFELAAPTTDGPLVSQKALGANALFARRTPRQLLSLLCGTNLFSARCGVLISDWTFNAVITAASGHVVTVNSIVRANADALPGGFGFADWFALGWVQWPGLDVTTGLTTLPQRAGILTSTVLASGHVTLTLDRAPGLAPGAALALVPGCDRTDASCWPYDATRTDGSGPLGTLGKFDNWQSFRGFFAVPAVAPAFIIPERHTTGAKK